MGPKIQQPIKSRVHTHSNSSARDEYSVVPLRPIGRIIASVIVGFLAIAMLISVLLNDNFRWDVVAEYFTADIIVKGILLTLQLTVICMVFGVVLGALLGAMRMSQNKLFSSISYFYVWFFRATPILVQLIFWFNLSALYPILGISLPFNFTLFAAETNTIMTPLFAAILCLTLNEAAHMAEVTRGGILGVDPGQTEAARALGMGKLNTMRIVAPQAMRMIIPPTGNELIGLLKNTSLVSVVGIADLLHSAQLVYAVNYLTIPLLTVAGLWYLIITSVLNVGQNWLERRFARGFVARKSKVRSLSRFTKLIPNLRGSND